MVLRRIFLFFIFSLFLPHFAMSEEKVMISPELLENLQPIEGNPSAQKSKTKDVILYFWATWCPDCKEKLTSEFKKNDLYQKFDIFLVATDKDQEKISHFQKKFQIPLRVYFDQNKELQKALKVYSVPTFIRMKPAESGYQVVVHQSGGKIEQHLKNEK